MQKRLPLPPPAKQVARFAVDFDLPDVPPYSRPSPDLPGIFGLRSAAHVVSTIPLKPAARIVGVYPSLPAPHGQGLARIDAEEVERAIPPLCGKPRLREPTCRKLVTTVRHVLSAEDAELEHLPRSKLRIKLRVKVAPGSRLQLVAIPRLHPVFHDNYALCHVSLRSGQAFDQLYLMGIAFFHPS
jgi:hypothetical protein